MATKKKILRGAEIHGETIIEGRIIVNGSGTADVSQFNERVNFGEPIVVQSTSEFQNDVTVDANLIVEGIIENDLFFALHRFAAGTTVEVATNEGVIIAGINNALNRYFINRGGANPAAPKTVDDSTVFSEANGWGEWFSGSGGTPTSPCVTEINVATTSRNWVDGNSQLGSTILWNADNTGFVWNLALSNARITQLCEHILNPPLPIDISAAANLSVSALTLNGTDDILSGATITTGENSISISYNETDGSTRIQNPNLTQNNTAIVTAALLLGTVAIKLPNGNDPVIQLFYTAPTTTLSLFTNSVRFDATYNSANVTRTFNGGASTSINPSSFVSTTFPNSIPATITPGASSISFSPLSRTASAAERTLTEVTRYVNATNNTDTRDITSTATVNPTFTFPVYLGSVSETTLSTFTATDVEGFKSDRLSSVDNQLSNNFTWPDPLDSSKQVRVMLIRSSFSNGRALFVKANENSAIGAVIERSRILAVGSISTDRENYDVYPAIRDQEGEATVYVEYN